MMRAIEEFVDWAEAQSGTGVGSALHLMWTMRRTVPRAAQCQRLEHGTDPCSTCCEFAAHGYQVQADAVSAERPYRIDCPSMLICGERDHAGSAKRYNRTWAQRTGNPVRWIKDAGHNSNCDAPDEMNELIGRFVKGLALTQGDGTGVAQS